MINYIVKNLKLCMEHGYNTCCNSSNTVIILFRFEIFEIFTGKLNRFYN